MKAHNPLCLHANNKVKENLFPFIVDHFFSPNSKDENGFWKTDHDFVNWFKS